MVTRKIADPNITEPMEQTETDYAGLSAANENEKAEEAQEATQEALALIPPHPCMVYDGALATLTLTIDFTTHTPQFYLSPAFATWRSSLLDVLPQYAALPTPPTAVINKLSSPHYRSHSVSIQRAQREILKRLASILGDFEELKKLGVVLKAPEIHWTQVQGLATFYGLSSRRVFLKQGEAPATAVRSGDEWDRKLKNLWRELAERREL